MRIINLKDTNSDTVIASDISWNYYLGTGTVWNVWRSDSGYAVGDIVFAYEYAEYVSGSTGWEPHAVFKALAVIDGSATDNKNPWIDSSRWEHIGTSDKWAAYDDLLSTYSQRVTSHTVTIDSAGCNYAILTGLDANSVTFTLRSTYLGTIKKTETINLTYPQTSSTWWAYFFEPKKRIRQLVWEFPTYSGSALTAVFTTDTGEMVKVGSFKVGCASDRIFGAQKGLTSKLRDYTTKGTFYAISAGPNARDIDFTCYLTKDNVDQIEDLFSAQIGRIAAYDCNDEQESRTGSLAVLAIINNFTRIFEYKDIIKCNVSLTGVT